MIGNELTYLIAANCIIGLENAHNRVDDNSHVLNYTTSEQAKVWNRLENLASLGQLKTITEVIGEVETLTRRGATRLKRLPRIRVRKSRAIMVQYQALIAQHSGWITTPPAMFDTADPLLIAAALINDYTVLIDELPASAKVKWSRNKPLIPDVCAQNGVACFSGLREFAKQKGWLD